MRYHAFSPVARFIKIDVQYVIIMIKGSWSTMKLKLKNIYILGVDIIKILKNQKEVVEMPRGEDASSFFFILN